MLCLFTLNTCISFILIVFLCVTIHDTIIVYVNAVTVVDTCLILTALFITSKIYHLCTCITVIFVRYNRSAKCIFVATFVNITTSVIKIASTFILVAVVVIFIRITASNIVIATYVLLSHFH